MKREFHKKDKSRPFEKRKDKASIQKETISKKLRLKNNIEIGTSMTYTTCKHRRN